MMHPLDAFGGPAAVLVGVPLLLWFGRGVVGAVLDARDERAAQGSMTEFAQQRRALARAAARR